MYKIQKRPMFHQSLLAESLRQGRVGQLISTTTEQLTANTTMLNVVRMNGGRPLIQADPLSWDNRFALNPTALYLERSLENDRLISGLLDRDISGDPLLDDGAVVVLYRGIPDDILHPRRLRSSVGCAIFTPDLKLIKRFDHPLVTPCDDPSGPDFDGVEDQRIARIGDKFYLTYCGLNLRTRRKIQICMAESSDLLNWNKLGPIRGDVNRAPNKNSVLLQKKIGGKYIMFHRPSWGRQSDFCISLATSDSPTGTWTDCGTVMKAVRHPRYAESWVGMGSSPIEVSENVFIADYHTGNYWRNRARDYYANFAVLDFRDFDPSRPSSIVRSRFDGAIFPETVHEVDSPWPGSNHLNCIFPCGSYEYKGCIYVIYGGADAYVLAAKVDKQEILERSTEIRRSGHKHAWAIRM